MARLKPKPSAVVESADGVPADIARGPHVPTWADPEALAAYEVAKRTRPEQEQQDACMAAMLSAHRNWSRARLAWLKENEIPSREQCKLIPSRAPRW